MLGNFYLEANPVIEDRRGSLEQEPKFHYQIAQEYPGNTWAYMGTLEVLRGGSDFFPRGGVVPLFGFYCVFIPLFPKFSQNAT